MCKDSSRSGAYEFRVEGYLDTCWSEWFDGLEIRYGIDEETGTPITLLLGPDIDQSRLYGILGKISRINLKLVSVRVVHAR